MAERTPTFAQVIEDAFASKQSELLFALPGEITSYSASDQTCSVRLLIKDAVVDEYGERQAVSYANVSGVPVVFPSSGLDTGVYSMSFPVAARTPVLVLFTSRSLDRWKELGGEVDPSDDRRQHISDAVAIPGLRAKPGALPSRAVDSNSMVFTVPSGKFIRLGDDTANDPVIRKSDLDAFISSYNDHTHTTPSGTSGTPIVPADASTGSSVVKVS